MLVFRFGYVALYAIATFLYITPFLVQNTQSWPILPVNHAHFVGVLNEKCCNTPVVSGFLSPPQPSNLVAKSCSLIPPSIPQETNQIFTKAANVAAAHESANTHQVSDAIKSASYKLFLESERMEVVEHKFQLLNADLQHKANDIGHEIGYMMVKWISAILPHVDSIGHKVLHMDDEIINYFINLDSLSPELKKRVILGIIHVSQQGDHFGAQMLQLYYDIVNKLM